MSNPTQNLTPAEFEALEIANFFAKVKRYLAQIETSDLAGLSVRDLSSSTQYTHKFTGKRGKGGHPPIDYTAVELKIDLEIAVANLDYDSALELYAQLSRIIG